MNNPPFSYQHINELYSKYSPSTVHVKNNQLSTFFTKYLMQKALSIFKWTLPETWDRDYFLQTLYYYGYVAIINTNTFGVIPQQCGLKGQNIFYRPTHAVISNPLLSGILEPLIDVQTVVIKLQPDYTSIYDLISYYGNQLALASEALSVNLLNSKLSYVMAAGSQEISKSLKKMYDNYASSEPTIVYDKSLLNNDGSKPWETFTQDLRSNFIANEIIIAIRKIEQQFDMDVGIPTANTEKKGNLIKDEVDVNNVETATKCDLWLEELKKQVKKANKMFNIKMNVENRYNYNLTGGESNGNDSNNESTRSNAI